MAGLVCSAIVGFLCVQAPIAGDPIDIKLSDGGIVVSDTIESKNWALSWGRSMEWAPPQLDTAKLNKACDGDTCVLYWRRCAEARCSYGITLDGKSGLFFDVAEKAAGGMKQAGEAMRIVVDFKAGTTVPLTKLDCDGPGEKAPVLPSADRPL